MTAQIVEIVTHAVYEGQMVLNRWHFIDTDGVADPAVLCADFTTAIINPLLPVMNSSMSFTQLIYQVIYPTMKLQHGYATGYPKVGADASAAGPAYVAASVRWNLGDTLHPDGTPATRHIKRGGKRLAGWSNSSNTGNTFSAAAQRAGIETSMNNVVAFPPDAWQACVVHFPPSAPPVPPLKTSPRLPPTEYALIVGHVLSPTWGSQVSRKFGHGK